MINPELMQQLLAFRRERDWEQFHTFKNLAISISLEAAELLETVQWIPDAEVAQTVQQNREPICNEIADIAIYLAYMAHDLGVDLDRAIQAKLALNAQKYPVAKSRGSVRKYDRL